jgi:hypothetical protein
MVIGRVLAWLKSTHRVKDLNLSGMSSRLGELASRFTAYQTEWEKMQNRPFTQLEGEQLFERLFDKEQTPDPPKIPIVYRTLILNQFRSEPDTVWGLYNAITFIASHRARGMNPSLALLDFANTVQRLLMVEQEVKQLQAPTVEGEVVE